MIVVVVVAALSALLTAWAVSLEISASFGCGVGKSYAGHQVCIQEVLTAVSAIGTAPPTLAATCPLVVPLNSSFDCWFNVTSSASAPQNLTNISAGDAGNPFTLLGLSNPLPLTLAPGQVAVEELTIRAPNASGAYNLLVIAEVVSAS